VARRRVDPIVTHAPLSCSMVMRQQQAAVETAIGTRFDATRSLSKKRNIIARLYNRTMHLLIECVIGFKLQSSMNDDDETTAKQLHE
jgi:hypothetical protein